MSVRGNKKWYNWPEGYYDKDLVPLYLIFRRLVFFPLQLFGFVVLYLGTLLGYGVIDAERIRKDLF